MVDKIHGRNRNVDNALALSVYSALRREPAPRSPLRHVQLRTWARMEQAETRLCLWKGEPYVGARGTAAGA
jgi:hypothetical protein